MLSLVLAECSAEGFPFLGWGPGVQVATRGRCVYVRQASASVRECRRVSRIVESRKSSRNAELSSLFTLSVQKCQQSQGSRGSWSRNVDVVTFGLVSGLRVSKVSTVTGIGGGVVVAKRRTVAFGLVSGLCVSKVSTVTGIGGSRGRETQNCRHFWTRLGSSRLKSLNNHRDRGVVVAKR